MWMSQGLLKVQLVHFEPFSRTVSSANLVSSRDAYNFWQETQQAEQVLPYGFDNPLDQPYVEDSMGNQYYILMLNQILEICNIYVNEVFLITGANNEQAALVSAPKQDPSIPMRM